MKTKITQRSFSSIMEEQSKKKKHIKPKRPNIFFRTLMRLVSVPDLIATRFRFRKIGMERIGKSNAFYIMNHSSFIDLEIAATVLYPRPFNIVATTDAFWGKEWLMRQIGCIPTKKFVADTTLVRDMMYAAKKLKNNIVMYPEVGYSFDGTATTLPDTVGKCVKMLGLPLAMIRTYGAFTRDPLYNNLQRRKVNVTADVELLLDADEVANTPYEKIDEIIKERFSFDNFLWQQENKIKVDEPFRADGLERVLYKCPSCREEGHMIGKGTHIKCSSCGKEYFLNEYGRLECDGSVCEFPHIPDWYRWERECVKNEIERGEYSFDSEVEIMVSTDTRAVYQIGKGRLTHSTNGFALKSFDGEINYEQKPLSSYSMCADFNWYEIGDIVSIGDSRCLYYCIPDIQNYPVAKMRLATEEIYKIAKQKKEADAAAKKENSNTK